MARQSIIRRGGSGSKEIYFRSDSDGGDAAWPRMGQFGFGGNLEWMAILACNSLCDPNFSSLVSHGGISLNTTHLVCGCDSFADVGEDIGGYWAKNMLRKKETVAQAWFDAGTKEYQGATNLVGTTIVFRVAGYPECMGDSVQVNTAPSSPGSAPGNLVKSDQQVYP